MSTPPESLKRVSLTRCGGHPSALVLELECGHEVVIAFSKGYDSVPEAYDCATCSNGGKR